METPLWLQIVAVFASPAIMALMLVIFNGRFGDLNNRISEGNINLNNRIDDLRNQMQREHDTLAKKVDSLDNKIDILLERGK